jgi:hypothetical protein
MSAETLAAIEEILASAEDADDALRRVVREIAGQPGVVWAGIAFAEHGQLAPGPSTGVPDEARRTLVTLCYKGHPVGELQVDGDADRGFLEAVAERISPHVLLGWDTGGEAWEP